jgi:K+-transporting ATPase ATPase A chain
MLAILVLPLILGFTAASVVLPFGLSGIRTQARTGSARSLSLRLPAITDRPSPASPAIRSNLQHTGGLTVLVGRYFVIIPMMAIAGSLVAKKIVPASAGTFPTHGGLFVGLLVGVILIIGGLVYFPALALGPIVEHLAMQAGTVF